MVTRVQSDCYTVYSLSIGARGIDAVLFSPTNYSSLTACNVKSYLNSYRLQSKTPKGEASKSQVGKDSQALCRYRSRRGYTIDCSLFD